MSAVVRPRVGNGPLEAAGRFHGSTTQRYGQNSKPARQSHAADATAYTRRSLAPADHDTLQYKYQLKYTCEQTLVQYSRLSATDAMIRVAHWIRTDR